jgi:Protein of unknown function (DUF3489)
LNGKIVRRLHDASWRGAGLEMGWVRSHVSSVSRDAWEHHDLQHRRQAWLRHTTRAALTGLKKKGYVISSDKVDGVRTYRAVTPE